MKVKELGAGFRSVELGTMSGFMGGRDLIKWSVSSSDSEVWSKNIRNFFLLVKVISL